ncbi:hypothetical protein [Flavobacterium sp. N1994]|uniref:hypothetical protein n=1 Tax=Flavobacterium sp. N1994 TaxID=2986827 RepID=UPI002222B47E|nr:hypothetical protein [Flavobacterium sp. N1994]
MKNKVIAILAISSEEYDEGIFQTYWSWCKKFATSENNCQSLLANAAINRWFMQQYAQYEKNFVDIVDHFPKKPNDLHYLYRSETVEIYKRFPTAIIGTTKKLNPEFETIINPQFKVYGN